MHYLRAGEGTRTIVLLHGWPETAQAWRKVIPFLTERGCTVVAPDLRGVGGSSRPSSGYDKKAMAADVRALLRDALGLERVACLVGHDIGGMVAYAHARQWPGEVDRLVLLDCLLPGLGLEAMFAARDDGRFAHMAFHLAPDGLPEALVAGREALYLGWFFRNLTYDQGAFSAEEIEAYAREYAAPGALRAGFEHYRAFWQDAEDNKAFGARGKLRVPVLAIGASLSVADRLEQSLRPVADDLSGVVLAPCGHFIPAEQPERLASEILAFIERGAVLRAGGTAVRQRR